MYVASGHHIIKHALTGVMQIAEKLYQKGFLSYPRTETDQFDNAFDHMGLIAKQTADPAWGAFATSLVLFLSRVLTQLIERTSL